MLLPHPCHEAGQCQDSLNPCRCEENWRLPAYVPDGGNVSKVVGNPFQLPRRHRTKFRKRELPLPVPDARPKPMPDAAIPALYNARVIAWSPIIFPGCLPPNTISPRAHSLVRQNTPSACCESGIRCAHPAFIDSTGRVQIAASGSNWSQVARHTHPPRCCQGRKAERQLRRDGAAGRSSSAPRPRPVWSVVAPRPGGSLRHPVSTEDSLDRNSAIFAYSSTVMIATPPSSLSRTCPQRRSAAALPILDST